MTGSDLQESLHSSYRSLAQDVDAQFLLEALVHSIMYGIRICSFHDADGEGVDFNGRTWRWEFSKMFGPLFVDQRGSPLRVQPGERSPAWRVFNGWYEKWKQVPQRDEHGR